MHLFASCYVRTVSHREMRNQSGKLLRHVAEGETILVTNHGQPAALIIPASTDQFADLVARGQVRLARRPLATLESIRRNPARAGSAAIISDTRGNS